jgi:hypothetical protein
MYRFEMNKFSHTNLYLLIHVERSYNPSDRCVQRVYVQTKYRLSLKEDTFSNQKIVLAGREILQYSRNRCAQRVFSNKTQIWWEFFLPQKSLLAGLEILQPS